MARGKSLTEVGIDLLAQLLVTEAGSGNAHVFGKGGQRRHAMIGGKRNPHISQSELLAQEIEEAGQLLVQSQGHGAHLRGIGANLVTQHIVCGKADGEQVGSRAGAQLLVGDKRARKIELVVVG
jgi:hypothetical protein